MPYRQARRTQRITCTERAAQACGGGSHSASIARHRCMLYAVPFRGGVVCTVASRTGCRPCFHPGWSRVFGGPLHNITCVSEGALGQDNRSTAGQACSTLARHSGTSLAAQHARHSTRQGIAPRFASICVMCSTSRRLSRLSVFVGTRYPE